MKVKFLYVGLTVLTAAALFSSCKKDNGASGVVKPEVSFGVTSDNSIATLNAAPNTGVAVNGSVTASSFTWTSGIANISSFKLEAKRNGVETEIKSKDLTHVDLFALTPSLIAASLDTGTYKEIELRVTFTKSATADIPLTLKGTFKTAGGATVPVEFDFNDNAVIKAESHDNVVVDGTSDFTQILSIHLNMLLNNITAADVDHATRTNGTILVSSTVNSDLYLKIISNLSAAIGSKGFEKHEKRK